MAALKLSKEKIRSGNAESILLRISFFIIFLFSTIQTRAAIPKVTKVPEIKIGTYIKSIYDINGGRGTFAADIWLSIISSKMSGYSIKKNLVIYYVISDEIGEGARAYHSNKDLKWDKKDKQEVELIQAVFPHHFNFQDFPFDKQDLKIVFEDSTDNLSKVKYVPDGSVKFEKDGYPDGWIIKNANSVSEVKEYNADLNPDDKHDKHGEQWSDVVVTISIVRDSPWLLLLKLMFGLWIAVFVSFCACWMDHRTDELFSGRMALIGGALIATVVSYQFADNIADNALGNTGNLTLVDLLYIVGMCCIAFLMLLTVKSRGIMDKPASKKRKVINKRNSKRFDLKYLKILTYSFIFVTIGCILLVRISNRLSAENNLPPTDSTDLPQAVDQVKNNLSIIN